MSIKDINFQNKKALVRVDFNVPLDDSLNVTDDTRIVAALPTIKYIIDQDGAVIIISHLDRPKGKVEDKFSLRHIMPVLSEKLNRQILFADDCIGEEAVKKAQSLKSGEVLLLENTRFHEGETKGDREMAEKLASLGDVYVNDAFGAAHRAHASTAIIAEFFQKNERCFGLLMQDEIDHASKVLKKPEKPFTAILGGAKVSDKLDVIENLLNIADNILIGGGMAYTFFKAEGGWTGRSIVEEDKFDLCIKLRQKAKEKNINLQLPQDSVIADDYSNGANTEISSNDEIPNDWMGLDIGPQAIWDFRIVILQSKTILWNGPMGVFEMEKFQNGTKRIAQAIAEATSEGAYSLAGGGDSIAAVKKLGLSDKISHLSTGGGALLEFFEGKELPGIASMRG